MFREFPKVDPESLGGKWGYVMESVEGFESGHIVPGEFRMAGGFVDHDRYISPESPVLVFVPDNMAVIDAGRVMRPKFVTTIESGACIRRIRLKTTRKHEAGWDPRKGCWICIVCESLYPKGECEEHVPEYGKEWEVVND